MDNKDYDYLIQKRKEYCEQMKKIGESLIYTAEFCSNNTRMTMGKDVVDIFNFSCLKCIERLAKLLNERNN